MTERRDLLQQSLNFYQSQIYSLNHLYNLHYNIMQNLNTNVTRIIMAQNELLSNHMQYNNPLPPPRPIYPGSNYFQSQPPPPPPPPPPANNRIWFPPPQTQPPSNTRTFNFDNNTNTNFNQFGAIGSNRYQNNNRLNQPFNRRRRTFRPRRSRNLAPLFTWRTINNELERTLNESVYDRNVSVSLPREIFNNRTTTDTWHNIHTLFDLSNNTRCPITQEVFEPINNVSRINHCGHVFNTDSLLEWFRHDTRCPVCRYNLLRGTENDISNNDISNNDMSNNDISRNTIINPFSSFFDTSLNNTFDLSRNINNISNEIAANIVSAFNSLGQSIRDFSDNFVAAEMTFNFPTPPNDPDIFSNSTDINMNDIFNGLNTTGAMSNSTNITQQSIIQPMNIESNFNEADNLGNIVENILNNSVFSETKEEEYLEEEKMEEGEEKNENDNENNNENNND